LQYKASWSGNTVLSTGQFELSSKLCTCGRINRDLEPSERELTCHDCGATHEDEVRAANGIKQMALNQIRRDTPESTPVERKR
jgi:putative transposase